MIKKIICFGLVIMLDITCSVKLKYASMSNPSLNKSSTKNSYNKNVISSSLTNVLAKKPQSGDVKMNINASSSSANNSLKIDGKKQKNGQSNLIHTSIGNIVKVIPDSD